MNKFTRVAQLSQFLHTLAGGTPTGADPLAWVQELLNPEALAKNAIFLAALFQNWSFRYDPAAFFHVEEIDKSRGYQAIDPNTGRVLIDPMTNKPMYEPGSNDKPYTFQHSQGHLEKLDYQNLQNLINTIPTSGPHGVTTEHQFSEIKPDADMPMFVKRNINISEDSPEYKKMFDKVLPGVSRPAPTTAEKKNFIKVAQVQQNKKAVNDQKINEIKKLLPKWDIKAMIDELDKIAQNGQEQHLPNNVIQLQIEERMSQYKQSLRPLHDYLKKNGYGQKTS